MPLSQVQIIQSLGEALAWFEKELVWGVQAAELRHLTGRIGELYAAMITRGQMALDTNQRGYDVVSAEGERISVKTITSSTHVTFRKSTFGQVDRVLILQLVTDEGEASIRELLDIKAMDLASLCVSTPSEYRYTVSDRPRRERSVDELAVSASAMDGQYRLTQYENGTVLVKNGNVRELVALPIIREIAKRLGVSPLNSNGNVKNTRQLGADVINALKLGG